MFQQSFHGIERCAFTQQKYSIDEVGWRFRKLNALLRAYRNVINEINEFQRDSV